MTIRPAAVEDLDAIASIQRASPEASQWEPSEYLAYTCTVAEDEGVVAFLVSREIAAGEYEILNLAVAPAARRLGVARALLDAVLEMNRGTWFLEVRKSNFAAIQMYENAGFTLMGERGGYYADSRESAIVMRLQRCYGQGAERPTENMKTRRGPQKM